MARIEDEIDDLAEALGVDPEDLAEELGYDYGGEGLDWETVANLSASEGVGADVLLENAGLTAEDINWDDVDEEDYPDIADDLDIDLHDVYNVANGYPIGAS